MAALLQVEIGGVVVRVGGIAKGSGMIHPNMATMLSVVTCDAAVEPGLWRALFKRSAVKSFNQARYRSLCGHHPCFSTLYICRAYAKVVLSAVVSCIAKGLPAVGAVYDQHLYWHTLRPTSIPSA